jgi:pimeloyl-ACP methyl ester carboxylesterase
MDDSTLDRRKRLVTRVKLKAADEMREMADSMQKARFLEIANAGHLAPLENPAPVSAAILEFLHQ